MDIELSNVKNQIYLAICGNILNRNVTSTGFTLNASFSQNESIGNLAELFWINSNIDQNDIEMVYTINQYLQFPYTEVTALSGYNNFTGFKKVPLSNGYPLELSFGEILKRRRTYRKYTGDKISFDILSTILHASNSITHIMNDGVYPRKQRTCPSGGGLYPIKLYLLINNVKNLSKGIYYYDPLNAGLIEIEKDQHQVKQFLDQESISEFPNIRDSCFILFITMEAWRSVAKYGIAGLRFALMEIGEISQNTYLASASLGIGACPYASFSSKTVNELLKIDGEYENFQHAIIFGVKAED